MHTLGYKYTHTHTLYVCALLLNIFAEAVTFFLGFFIEFQKNRNIL